MEKDTFPLYITSLDNNLEFTDVKMLVLTSVEGEMAVLANHVPMVVLLKSPSAVKVIYETSESIVNISGGILNIESDKVILLSDKVLT